MRILYIAYPLLPVSAASAGGAEQMLWTLEREMARRGHETSVAACAGSEVSGTLYATGELSRESDTFPARNIEHRDAILRLLRTRRLDVIHDKSGSFFVNATPFDAPVLATLHLPRSFYPSIDFHSLPGSVVLNCVSESQRAAFADVPNIAGVVGNGIALEHFPLQQEKRDYLLWIGRICEEKGAHLAIRAAQKARRKLVLAGQVYPFRYHQEYFEREVRPHLAGDVEFVDSPSFEQKIDLLAHASALLVPSLAEETSSLVSLEAMACGTPVIAFRHGALPQVVRPEESGLLVDNVEEMAAAVGRVSEIAPVSCRALVMREYSATRMADGYEHLYRSILSQTAQAA